MSKLIKRFIALLGIILLLVLIAAIAVPYFYKDEILSYVKEDLNKSLNAETDFTDVNLSLFQSFPNLHCSIEDLRITGKTDFEGVDLIRAKRIGFNLDLMSVIKKEQDIQVNSVEFISPVVDIRIDKNGNANYNILKSAANLDQSSEDSKSNDYSFVLNLDRYAFENADIQYDDRANNLKVKAIDLNHSGKGDFTESTFDLITKTDIQKLTVANAGISYLSNDRLNMDLALGVNTTNKTYTIKENDLKINALKLAINGMVSQKGEGYNMDLKVQAPGNQFKELLSILPGAYTSEFSKVNAGGSFSLSSIIKGLYDSSKNQYPNVDLNLAINDGQFQYPGMPSGLEQLFTNLKVAGNLGNLDALKIEADKFNFKINNESFTSNFLLTNLKSNPSLDGKLSGKIDFGFIGKNFPLEGVQKLEGIFDTNLEVDASYQELENGNIDDIKLSGTAEISNFIYDADGLPAVKINTANAVFSPKSVALNGLSGNYGKSDFKGNGTLKNFLALLLPTKTMVGTFDITSNRIDVDELIGFEEKNQSRTESEVTNTATAADEIFDRFDFKLTAKVGDLKYDHYPISDFQFDGRIQPNAIAINTTKGFLGKSDFAAKGKLTDIFNYLYNNGTLSGTLDIGSNAFDLNDYMAFSEASPAEAKSIANEDDFEAIILPERTNIDITTRVKKLVYTDLNFTNVKGKINIKDQVASIKNGTLYGLGGKMMIDGSYDSSTAKDPKFNLDYGMQKVDFGQVFTKLVSWQKIAPLGKFLTGNFNTTMKFKGSLKDGFYPDLNTLSADGFLQTLDATLRAFPPIEKVANKLNISAFKNLRIQNTKNWFEIKDGKIEVKDFDFKHKGIAMVIGGSHGLNQDMDYKILAKIPRDMIQGNKVGQLANQGLGFLAEQAGKLGIKMDPGSFLNVRLNIGGSISAPTLKVDVLGSDGKSTIKEQVVNTVKETVKTAVDSVKTVVTNKVDEEKKALKAKMDKEIKTVLNLAEKQAKSIRDAGKKAAAQAKKLGYDQADKLVRDAGNNIFKKKAAELAAKKIKSETDKKVTKIEQEADKKAEQIMTKARNKVKDIQKKYQSY